MNGLRTKPRAALPLDEWRATFIRFCPTCNVETLPLDPHGICAWCETVLADPTDAGDPDRTARCLECNEPFELSEVGGQGREFCTTRCKRTHWNRTPTGIAWAAEKARRRKVDEAADRAAYKDLTARLGVDREWSRWKPHHRELLAGQAAA